RRRHTRLVSDWSSDVCSSDLSSANAQGRSLGDDQVEGRRAAVSEPYPARRDGRARRDRRWRVVALLRGGSAGAFRSAREALLWLIGNQQNEARRPMHQPLSHRAIEPTAPCRQPSSCDLSQGRRYRVLGTFRYKATTNLIATGAPKCYLCSRSVLLPMFPAAQWS